LIIIGGPRECRGLGYIDEGLVQLVLLLLLPLSEYHLLLVYLGLPDFVRCLLDFIWLLRHVLTLLALLSQHVTCIVPWCLRVIFAFCLLVHQVIGHDKNTSWSRLLLLVMVVLILQVRCCLTSLRWNIRHKSVFSL